IKAMAGMDMGGAARRPLDGRWIYHADTGPDEDDHTQGPDSIHRVLDDEANVDLRISVLPTLHGEDFAIRLLGRGLKAHRIDGLGMMREQLGDFSAMIESPGGLIALSGPTGSGKTATLYAALMRLNNGRRKIN